MKVKVLVETLEKILKSYKKEIESSININIIESVYYDEGSESIRRQIVIDYAIEYKKQEKTRKDQDIYHI
jgi:hypothetical protein